MAVHYLVHPDGALRIDRTQDGPVAGVDLFPYVLPGGWVEVTEDQYQEAVAAREEKQALLQAERDAKRANEYIQEQEDRFLLYSAYLKMGIEEPAARRLSLYSGPKTVV